MDPNFMVVQTMTALVWMVVGVLLAVLIIFALVALANLIGILKSVNKITRQIESKTTLFNNFLDQYVGLLFKKIAAIFTGKKSEDNQEAT
jgi:Flp pilus assembly protein TadB